jgi:3-oxoacyl-[acyl-carrier protein] reductase
MTGSNELSAKVAIVTGAGRNIGRAIALALGEVGAWIVVNARSNRGETDAVAREIVARGGKALVHICDVADATAVQAMADVAINMRRSFTSRTPRGLFGSIGLTAVHSKSLSL